MGKFIKILILSFFISNPMPSKATSADSQKITLNAFNGKINFFVPKDFQNAVTPAGERGFWLFFRFPSMTPIKPSENQLPDAVSLLVRIGNPSTPTISEMQLQVLQNQVKISLAEHVGVVNVFGTFSSIDATGEKKFTYFSKQNNGDLLCFEEVLRKINSTRPYGKDLELKFIFNKSLFQKKLDIDKQVISLVGRMMIGESK